MREDAGSPKVSVGEKLPNGSKEVTIRTFGNVSRFYNRIGTDPMSVPERSEMLVGRLPIPNGRDIHGEVKKKVAEAAVAQGFFEGHSPRASIARPLNIVHPLSILFRES